MFKKKKAITAEKDYKVDIMVDKFDDSIVTIYFDSKHYKYSTQKSLMFLSRYRIRGVIKSMIRTYEKLKPFLDKR